MELKKIAVMRSDLTSKFGLPRQGTLIKDLLGEIVIEKEYSVSEAFRGIEEYSHLYIMWGFSENEGHPWSPTVRPPRLGGNKRVGVFATRSPFRPNPLGLTIVELKGIRNESGRIVLEVAGSDLMDGTPIYDIKPYLPYVDSHPEANGGFAEDKKEYSLRVDIPQVLANKLSDNKLNALIELLSHDPRPSYQADPDRIYGFPYAGREVRFRVEGDTLHVTEIE
jgi:tRNA-Thr(GGU) m(6)t(6)A37 methyltransferase TsaA